MRETKRDARERETEREREKRKLHLCILKNIIMCTVSMRDYPLFSPRSLFLLSSAQHEYNAFLPLLHFYHYHYYLFIPRLVPHAFFVCSSSRNRVSRLVVAPCSRCTSSSYTPQQQSRANARL